MGIGLAAELRCLRVSGPPIQDVRSSSSGSRRTTCPICGGATHSVGTRRGAFCGRDFELRRCPGCRLALVADPVWDVGSVYDERYYAGQGADPLVDYRFELDHPGATVRVYEWRGIERLVADLRGGLGGVRWLDYGCGNGGLVRYLRERGHDATGFEEGAIVATASSLGIPILSRAELSHHAGSFDVVTAIEVIEHLIDPLQELRSMRSLLRPGGLLFVTTGNAAPFADRLTKWSYATPEIHVSLFEPATLGLALRLTGFRPEYRDLGPGFHGVLKFKVLKNLRIRRRSSLLDAIPPRLLAAPADRYARLSAHPIGWAVDTNGPRARPSTLTSA